MTPPMSPGERLIWSSLYASYVTAGNSAAVSARSATLQLGRFRRLTLADLERARGPRGTDTAQDALEVVEQMRGPDAVT